MVRKTATQQDDLRILLSSYFSQPRPESCSLAFRLNGVDIEVTTDRIDTAAAVSQLMGHARKRSATHPDRLRCYVFTEPTDRPPLLDRFKGASFVAQWENTGYFAWKRLTLIDFYPWATAIIDAVHGMAVLFLNALEIPPPLIFSNQLFYQTLEPLLNSRGIFPIHASAVALGRRAVLFPAPSEYGKTTLALAMVRAGYRYLGDDKPMIVQRAGRPTVIAFPEPINAYVDELRQFPELPARPHPDFPPDFPLKVSFSIETYWPGCVMPSAIPKALIFPEPRPKKPIDRSLIEPLSCAESMRRLIELNWPLHLPGRLDGFMDMMRDLVARTPSYRIECGTQLDDLPERIGALLNR